MKRSLIAALVLLLTLTGNSQTPGYRVVPLWPQPLPNHWVLGSVTGVAADAQDHVWVTHRGADFDRQSLTELTNFGEGGHYPGQFYSMHSIAVDSMGNLYTTETYQGRRVQKFLYRGLGPVTKKVQGTPWPTTTTSQD